MLDNLFSPYTLKGKVVKNRIIVPAMVTNFCTAEGKATEQYIAYHEAKARGGFGLIITENYAIDPLGRGFKNVAGLWNDDQIASHTKLVERVHQYDTTILAQIYHCGRQTNRGAIGDTPVAPTAIPCPFGTDIPRELSINEIKELVEKYGDAALRAKKCGFDGVEIHGGHGYLITQFLSPFSNKRVDEYGGNFINRARFALEVINNVRTKCGSDFIIGMRISVDEMVEGGLTMADSKALVPYLERAGVDLLNISVGNYLAIDLNVASAYTTHGWFADRAAEIKQICSIPVIAVSRINDPILADSIIREGKADFTAMGRASLADPDMPNKAQSGKYDEIRHCIACNHGCIGTLFEDGPIRCVLNPSLGKEFLPSVATSVKPKKITVIGAGPAGLEAAISAKKAGHDVTVYEKEKRAGGQFYIAAIPPCKSEISDFVRWQVYQSKLLGIHIYYDTEATIDNVREGDPDTVIIATGAVQTRPPIKGVDFPHVVFANDVLDGKVFPGRNCVVIGGGQVGAETAHHLAQQLRNVTVLEMSDTIAKEEAIGNRWQLLKSLEERKVSLITSVRVVEIKENEVIFDGADISSVPADMVILATGSKSLNHLADDFIGSGIDVQVIGDAKKVRNVMAATHEGYAVGLLV
jgi:2,4-dienoyl-CoA reductase-like NADH-dependent reductase (Old Yellow Enzyme family)/thioredoxin reductase